MKVMLRTISIILAVFAVVSILGIIGKSDVLMIEQQNHTINIISLLKLIGLGVLSYVLYFISILLEPTKKRITRYIK